MIGGPPTENLTTRRGCSLRNSRVVPTGISPVLHRDIDPRASEKSLVGPGPWRDERPFGERQQDPIEVQDNRLRGRVFSLHWRPVLNLQIWAPDEADVPEA